MNKEYIMSSNDNITVMNETDAITKQVYNNNIQEIILSKNEITTIENKLEKLNKDLHDQKGVVFLTKWMLICQPILILLATLGGFAFGSLSSTNDFLARSISYGVHNLVSSSVIFGPAAIFYGTVKLIYNKKLKKTKTEITKAKELMKTYENKLSTIREKQLNITSPTITINKPVSTIKQTNVIETEMNNELNEIYEKNLDTKPKKLILRRKKEKI